MNFSSERAPHFATLCKLFDRELHGLRPSYYDARLAIRYLWACDLNEFELSTLEHLLSHPKDLIVFGDEPLTGRDPALMVYQSIKRLYEEKKCVKQ
jgi:hypothetical protein